MKLKEAQIVQLFEGPCDGLIAVAPGDAEILRVERDTEEGDCRVSWYARDYSLVDFRRPHPFRWRPE